MNETEMSQLSLANVEALANELGEVTITCAQVSGACLECETDRSHGGCQCIANGDPQSSCSPF